jgi:hypothetical protein
LPSWTRCAKPYALLILAVLAGLVAPLQAQVPWDLRLIIDPYPSPYLSDWEANPTISTLTVSNPGAQAESVNLVYQVVNQAGQLIASGRSDPQLFSPGSTVITSFVDITGNSSHDHGVEDQMRRTGRLPEGDYTACTVATDPGGFVLAEDCANFSILYPDPPYLVGPGDGDVVQSPNPTFQWTPSQVPPQYRLQYVFRLAEVLPDQAPLQALNANIPQFLSTDVPGTNLPYPISALPLEPGHHYAWRVQAIDQNGYPAASNNGLSEIGTFVYQPAGELNPEGPLGGGTVRITFFDPATEHPELWAILDTASIDRVMDYLERKAREGSMEIPIPFPSALQTAARGPPPSEPRHPWGDGPDFPASATAAACKGFEGTFDAHRDRDKHALAVRIEPNLAHNVHDLLRCIGIPPYMVHDDDVLEFAAMLTIQGNVEGLPRITLGLKPFRSGDVLSLLGMRLEFSAYVFNLLGDFTLKSADLPADVHEFYGDHELDLWGPGTEDFLKSGFQGVMSGWKEQSAKAGASTTKDELLKLLGVNYSGVVDLGDSGPVTAAINVLCAMPVTCLKWNTVTLRGYAGNHGGTLRGVSLGGTAGRSDLAQSDKWALWASVPTESPNWEPLRSLVTRRELQLEIGVRDSSTGDAVPVDPRTEAPTQERTRFVLRDVLTGFDAWKGFLGVPAEEPLSFFGEFKAEITGAGDPAFVYTRKRSGAFLGDANDTTPKVHSDSLAGPTMDVYPDSSRSLDSTAVADTGSAWGRTQLSLAWGAEGTFDLFGGALKLHDPTLRLRRAEQSADVGTTSGMALGVNIGGGWGFRGLEDFGTIEIDIDPHTTRARSGRADALGSKADTAATRAAPTPKRRLRFKLTARFSEDAAVDKLVSLLWGLAVPEPGAP